MAEHKESKRFVTALFCCNVGRYLFTVLYATDTVQRWTDSDAYWRKGEPMHIGSLLNVSLTNDAIFAIEGHSDEESCG